MEIAHIEEKQLIWTLIGGQSDCFSEIGCENSTTRLCLVDWRPPLQRSRLGAHFSILIIEYGAKIGRRAHAPATRPTAKEFFARKANCKTSQLD